jgi:hypothetical protein
MSIKHAYEAIKEVKPDGDIDAVVVKIQNTGDSGVVETDRYKHTVNHGLNRVPVGCVVIMSDDFTNVKTVDKDSQKIIVQFDKARAYVHLRIW